MLKQAKVHLFALGALAFGSLAGVGCALEEDTGALEDGTGEEIAELEEPAGDELAAEESASEPASAAEAGEVWDRSAAADATDANLEPGRYCVDQSHASIQFVDIASCGGLPCTCPPELTPHAQFSRNHPVNVKLYGCGAYFFVKDLWSDRYGWMRQDALRPC